MRERPVSDRSAWWLENERKRRLAVDRARERITAREQIARAKKPRRQPDESRLVELLADLRGGSGE